MESLINSSLLTMMALVAISIVGQKNLFSVAALTALYSFLMASVLVVLDAVDVAMTEACVGAGISTVLLLGAMHLSDGLDLKPSNRRLIPLTISILVVAFFMYGSFGLPLFGEPESVIHLRVATRYLSDSLSETGVPNVVTSVLASYRGFDTLGETFVVFTAGIGVLALFSMRRRGTPK